MDKKLTLNKEEVNPWLVIVDDNDIVNFVNLNAVSFIEFDRNMIAFNLILHDTGIPSDAKKYTIGRMRAPDLFNQIKDFLSMKANVDFSRF